MQPSVAVFGMFEQTPPLPEEGIRLFETQENVSATGSVALMHFFSHRSKGKAVKDLSSGKKS